MLAIFITGMADVTHNGVAFNTENNDGQLGLVIEPTDSFTIVDGYEVGVETYWADSRDDAELWIARQIVT